MAAVAAAAAAAIVIAADTAAAAAPAAALAAFLEFMTFRREADGNEGNGPLRQKVGEISIPQNYFTVFLIFFFLLFCEPHEAECYRSIHASEELEWMRSKCTQKMGIAHEALFLGYTTRKLCPGMETNAFISLRKRTGS